MGCGAGARDQQGGVVLVGVQERGGLELGMRLREREWLKRRRK